MTDQPVPAAIPPEWQRGMAIAAALMAAGYGGDSGEDVDRLIEMLYQRGYEITPLAPAPTAPAGLLAVVDKAIYDWPAEGPQTLAEFVADRLAAIASPSEEPGLDAERLAEAYDVVMALAPDARPTPTRWEVIGRMYARLAKEPGS